MLPTLFCTKKASQARMLMLAAASPVLTIYQLCNVIVFAPCVSIVLSICPPSAGGSPT